MEKIETSSEQSYGQQVRKWPAGSSPVCVVMISLNEEHNMRGVLENLSGWASEVVLVDSYSSDRTVDIALEYGVKVVQRKFKDFGDQWNFAVTNLDISCPWTMKIDPDERLSDRLKTDISKAVHENSAAVGLSVNRSLWFMGRKLPVTQTLLRVWRTGQCKFTDVTVNEHPIVLGEIVTVSGDLEHHDSPDLHHWFYKQNKYTTSEAAIRFHGGDLAFKPRILGDSMERRMWIKRNFYRMPFRYLILFAYHFFWDGAWRAGRAGYIWSRLRCDVMRFVEYKAYEMNLRGDSKVIGTFSAGVPDARVKQYE